MTPPPKSGDDKTKEPAKRKATPRVTVTNTYRNRPVLFHARGTAFRLGPTESVEIEEYCLATPELSKLVRRGAVTVQTGKKSARSGEADSKDDADDDEAAEQGKKSEERGRRPS